MGIVTEVAEDAVGISTSTWLTLGCCAAIATAALLYHHHVFKSGEAACKAEYTAAADNQKVAAQIEIAKIGDKYAIINEKLHESPIFMRPVSPLVGAAISGMPQPHPNRAK
jgi:hypothetical protein